MTQRDLWRVVFTRWDDVVSLDLHERFHLDTESASFGDRPWWWARARILGLLDFDTRLRRVLTAEA